MQITTDASFQKVIKSIDNVTDKLSKEVGVAAWKTANYGKSQMAKRIQPEIAVPQREIKKHIKVKRIRQQMSQVTLDKTKRFSLKAFKPRQQAKGTGYKTSRKRGRKRLDGSFMGPRPGVVAVKLRGHVWMRVGPKVMFKKGARKGSMGQRIIKLYGPGVHAAFLKNDNKEPMRVDLDVRFLKELNDRLRYLRLKRSGQL